MFLCTPPPHRPLLLPLAQRGGKKKKKREKKFTLPGEIMAYIVMLKRLVFTKRNKGEAVASPGGH